MTTPNPPKQYLARLEDKTVHNEKFTQYAFELVEPHTMDFLSGQYVSIKVADRGDRRSYSICSSPGIKHGFETLVDIAPQGLGTSYLESLKFGDQVELLAPMGMFVLDQSGVEEETYLIATGSGISPFMSMITDLLQEKQDQRPINLYWGLRYAEDLFWLDEFEVLGRTFRNFSFTPTLSRAPDEWPLSRGRVTDIMSAKELNPAAGYYLCGNEGMISEMIQILTDKGVPKERIHHEKFF